MVGAVGIEIATPQTKSRRHNGVAPPPFPIVGFVGKCSLVCTHGYEQFESKSK